MSYIDMDCDRIVGEASDKVIEIMSENIDVDALVASAVDDMDIDALVGEAVGNMDLTEIVNDAVDVDSAVDFAVDNALGKLDLSDAIQSTLKMHPEIVMGALVAHVRKESEQQVLIENQRSKLQALNDRIERLESAHALVQESNEELRAELQAEGDEAGL